MSGEFPIPEEAIARMVPLLTHVMTDHDADDAAWDLARAAAPLIVAANQPRLPEPLPRDDDSDPYAWRPEGVDDQVTVHPESGEVDFAFCSWSPAAARAMAEALMAAADYAERRPSVLRGEETP